MFATAPVRFHRSAHAGVPAVAGTEVSSSLRKPATIAGIRRPFATSWTTGLHAVHEVGSRDLDERSDLPGFQSRRIVPINFLGRLDANIDIKNKLSTQKGDVSEDTDLGLLRFPRSFRHLVLMRGKGRQHFGLFSLRHREMIE